MSNHQQTSLLQMAQNKQQHATTTQQATRIKGNIANIKIK